MPEQRDESVHLVNRVFLSYARRSPLTYAAAVVVVAVFRAVVVGDTGPADWVAAVLAFAVALTCRLRVGEPPYAGNLPGVPEGRLRPFPVRGITVQRLAQGLLLLTLLVALLPVPGWLVLAAAVVTTAVWWVSIVAALRCERQIRRIRRALDTVAPQIGIPYAGFGGGPLQIAMWEPYLARSGLPGVLFNWRDPYFEKILTEAAPTWPIVQLSHDKDLDIQRLLPATVRALFYVHNASQNQRWMAHADARVKHVWVGHGDSDKPASYLSRQSDYDWLVVAGQAAIDRYTEHGVEVPREKFVILGRPQTSDIMHASGPISAIERPTVLYAPTWQGKTKTVDFSSLMRSHRLIRALIARDVRIIFRPHPLSYRWPRKRLKVEKIQAVLAKDKDGGHIWGPQADTEWGVVECVNACDVLISDVSSVVSDFLQSEKPYAMFSMRDSIDEFRAEFPVARSGYVILGDLSNLEEVLDEMLGPDPLAEARAERKRYVLGDFVGQESPEAFAEFVRGLARDY